MNDDPICEICGKPLGRVFNLPSMAWDKDGRHHEMSGVPVHLGACTDEFWEDFFRLNPDMRPSD
jgi:hypothetical protein